MRPSAPQLRLCRCIRPALRRRAASRRSLRRRLHLARRGDPGTGHGPLRPSAGRLRAGLRRLERRRAIQPPRRFRAFESADPNYDWSAVDAAVRDASARGLKVLMAVTRAPAWAEGPGRLPRLTRRPEPGSRTPLTWAPSPARSQPGTPATSQACPPCATGSSGPSPTSGSTSRRSSSAQHPWASTSTDPC